MRIEVALRRLGDLEQALADLYEWYSDVFAADAEAVCVFIKMAREERALPPHRLPSPPRHRPPAGRRGVGRPERAGRAARASPLARLPDRLR
jgi:hypothetical protein